MKEKRRFWSEEDFAFVRDNYHTIGAPACAKALGRTQKAVWFAARKLRITRHVHRMTATDAKVIQRMAAEGSCNRCIGRAIGFARNIVRAWRRRLGIPDLNSGGMVGTCKTCVDRAREQTRRQLAAAGLRSLGELRSKAFADFARESGWPDDLRPREVQILNVLAKRGVPMTREEIALAIGMRTDRIGCNGSPAVLVGNSRGGTYTASLVRRGLLSVIRRGATVRGQGKGRSRHLYMLGTEALRILEERCRSQNCSR